MIYPVDWRVYPTLKNVLNERGELDQEFLLSIRNIVPPDLTWIVQEKINGSRLSFYYSANSGDFRFCIAPRNYTVGQDSIAIIDDLIIDQQIKANLARLFDNYNARDYVVIHGSLIGGSYPHESVEKNLFAVPLSEKNFYSADNHFYAFDVEIDGRYLTPEQAVGDFSRLKMLHAPMRLIAHLDDCLAHPNTFETDIPKSFGLPPIEGNHCSGIVLRPAENYFDEQDQKIILKKQ
jgi:hypothetical protein